MKSMVNSLIRYFLHPRLFSDKELYRKAFFAVAACLLIELISLLGFYTLLR